jgi:hypothetical protein
MLTKAPHPAATPRTDMIRRKLKLVRGSRYSDRALRFKQNQAASTSPVAPIAKHQFGDIVNLPDWLLADAQIQALIGLCAAILSQRPAIDRELSGERLVAISELVGSDLFEHLCDYPVAKIALTDGRNRLSRPEDFEAIGEEIRHRALPLAFGGIENGPEKAAASICALAAQIIETTASEP